MVRKEAILLLVFALAVISEIILVSATADVAYIYRKDFKIDQNILKAFNESNITYDLIDERDLPVNFAQYKLIFVGDENFRYENRILVNQFPSVVANYYHANYWGFTDAEGVSQMGATHPLNVKRNGRIIQVYTEAKKYPGGPSVVYYFLDEDDKAPGLQTFALTETTESGDMFGDVISTAPPGTQLFNGRTQQAKLCFFGIIDTDYWTPAAKNLFKECIGYVGAQCEIDDDCPDPEYSPGFCQAGDVYRNVTRYTCQPDGAFNECVENKTVEFVQDCPFDCQNGQCIGQCEQDSDCGNDTFVGDPFCSAKNVTKTFQNYTCLNPGTPNSQCKLEVKNLTQQTCQDICIDGTCQNIACFNNTGCNDNNSSTQDACVNPGTVQSFCKNDKIACFTKTDCGIDGFITDPICSGLNVTRLYKSFTCSIPGNSSSFCSSTQEQRVVEQCADICVNGACQGVECFSDSECNDQNSSTLDNCVNPGTVNSECTNTPINCASDLDCGFTGFTGQEFCSGKNVVKLFQNATCFNDGTLQSYCSVTQQNKVLESCSDICVNGNCLDSVCSSNADCNDFNPLTYDRCINPGTVISECTNTPINCASDIDCGTTGYLGEKYCSSDRNVTRNFQTADCINPGELYSYCDISVNQTLLNQCDYACYDGICIRCDANSDCNDNNPQTIDLCQNPGALNAFCTNEQQNGTNVACNLDSDCGVDSPLGSPFCTGQVVSQLLQSWDCKNPGTQQSYCSTNIITQALQTCPNYCIDGACQNIACFNNADCNDNNSSTRDLCKNPGTVQSFCSNEPISEVISCSQDSDCGLNSPISPQFCAGNDVSQLLRNWDCVNPNTPQSYCSSSIIVNLIENCQEYCLDGDCVDIACFNNADCSDNNAQTVDICVNPGTEQSYCTNNPFEITCYQDSDCGADGLIGDPFCIAKNVTKLFQQFECNLAGTPQSYCSTSASQVTLEQCANLCINGQCSSGQGECTPGQIMSCGSDIGECTAGINVCFANSSWSSVCFGVIEPAVEVCDGKDNDCDGQTDEGGVCGNQCTNECISGSNDCVGNGFRTCGNFDSDPCTEWSYQPIQCSFGTICQDGQCITPQPQCTNECVQGSSQCSGNGYQTCGNFDSDNCLEWSQLTQCSFGTICQDGQCITPQPQCTNECISGQTRCQGNGFQTCGNFDSDSCTEWSYQPIQCSFGTTCQNGNCV